MLFLSNPLVEAEAEEEHSGSGDDAENAVDGGLSVGDFAREIGDNCEDVIHDYFRLIGLLNSQRVGQSVAFSA